MSSGGEQAGWVAFGVAIIYAIGQIVDRLIARWRPGSRVRLSETTATRLERERIELAAEWETYRQAVNRQLADCRSENTRLQRAVEERDERILELRGTVARLQFQIDVLKARGDE